MAEADANFPRDAKIIKTLLKAMGINDYEPHVVHQFLELWYRYIVDVLMDAQVYSEHAEKATVDCDDVKLAVQSGANFSFSQPLPREILLELARNRNNIPLLRSVAGPGILLPHEQELLISPNYQLAIPKKQTSEVVEETQEVKMLILILTQPKIKAGICHKILLNECLFLSGLSVPVPDKVFKGYIVTSMTDSSKLGSYKIDKDLHDMRILNKQ